MFSLIITIISVALVAALALATLYYGGEAFNRGRAQAQVAKVKNQAQQLLAASVLYKLNHGRYPLAVADMVPEYLETIPVAQVSAVSAAFAAEDWTMVTPGEPVFVLATESTEVCQGINESAYGSPGVLTEALTDTQVQCYGPSTTELTTLAALNTQSLETAATSGTEPIPLRTEGVPTDPASDAWLVSPCEDCTPSEGAPADVGGTGDGVLSVSPAPITFGDPYPYASDVYQLVLTNTGTGPINFTQAAATSNAAFSVYPVLGSSCAPIPVGETCWLNVEFAPTAAGAVTGNLTFDTDGGPPVSIELSGTSATHIASGAWSSMVGSTTAVDTAFAATPLAQYRDKQVFLRNANLDGQLKAGFTLVGDTQHFSIAMVPTHYSAMSPGWTVGCGLAADKLSTTGECTANFAHTTFPNGYVHLSVYVRYAPLSAGTHSVQLIPATSGTAVLPGALTFTGSGY